MTPLLRPLRPLRRETTPSHSATLAVPQHVDSTHAASGAVFTLGSREGVLSWDIGAWEAPFTALQVTETLSVGASVQGAPAGDGEDGAVAVVTERTSDAPARVQIVHCLA